MLQMLYKHEFKITDELTLYIPTVGEILDNEEDYYGMVNAITAMPIDYMVILDEINIDFTEISEYELFLLLFQSLQKRDTSLLFKDMDLSHFVLKEDDHNNMYLQDNVTGAIINYAVYSKLALALRTIHDIKKDVRTPANQEAKEYMLERAKAKAKRARRRTQKSQIEPLIIAMVNTEQFKYNYQTVRDLTIYQFNESVKQIISKVDYDNLMHGIYAGTVDQKSVSKESFNWLTHE